MIFGLALITIELWYLIFTLSMKYIQTAVFISFQTLTSGNLKWHLPFKKKYRFCAFTYHIKFIKALLLELYCVHKVLIFYICGPDMTFDLYEDEQVFELLNINR